MTRELTHDISVVLSRTAFGVVIVVEVEEKVVLAKEAGHVIV
jgi:hypothetical protein